MCCTNFGSVPNIIKIILYYLTECMFLLQCSHLVVDDHENVSDTYKARTALKYGVPVVSLTFIDDCLKAERLLEADGYIAVGQTKAEEFGSGKIVG